MEWWNAQFDALPETARGLDSCAWLGARAVPSTTTAQFTRHRRFVDAAFGSALGVVEMIFQQSVNLVSLLWGKLLIGHQKCFLDMVVKATVMLSQLAH